MMQIRFDGPPSHVSGRFIEVEDDRGRSIKVGEWRQDGPDWLLVIPDDENLRQTLRAQQEIGDVQSLLSEVIERLDGTHYQDERQMLVSVSARLNAALVPEEKRMPGSIGEKLDQIIAEASAFSEFDVRTDDAFRLIVRLAHDIDNQLEDRLCPSQDTNGECRLLNEARSHSEDLERKLATSFRVQNAIRQERSYAEGGRRRYKERLDHVQAQLSALHGEFRTAAQRLKFVANWLTNTYAKGPNADATAARGYAAVAKEVLDRGLDWLVERNRNRGRGVMESTAASKSAGAGSSPAARATRGAAEMMGPKPIQNDLDLCMLCNSGGGCVYASWPKATLWEEITRRLAGLAAEPKDVAWAVNEQRAILNLMWHYRNVEARGAPI